MQDDPTTTDHVTHEGVPFASMDMSNYRRDQMFRQIAKVDPHCRRLPQTTTEREKFLLTIIHYQGMEAVYRQRIAALEAALMALRAEAAGEPPANPPPKESDADGR